MPRIKYRTCIHTVPPLEWSKWCCQVQYNDVTMSTMAPQITSLTIVYSIGYSGTDQRKHQSSASLAFVRGIGKTPVRIILWCPSTKMFIKACFLIQPVEQEGGCQKYCIYLCSKVFINHFYQIKASPGCLNILIYWTKHWVDRLRRTLRRKV